jgi:hypothetical protein
MEEWKRPDIHIDLYITVRVGGRRRELIAGLTPHINDFVLGPSGRMFSAVEYLPSFVKLYIGLIHETSFREQTREN